MRMIFRFYNNDDIIATVEHDNSIMHKVPNVGDEIIDKYNGLVQRRTFDYIRGFVVIYIKI